MRHEIIDMCVEVLKRTGHPDATPETVFTDDDVSREFLGLLGACRPLKVVRDLISDVERERRARGFDCEN